jgi:CRP/FNR family transcriptional regulator, cyclic AMP receptor protein
MTTLRPLLDSDDGEAIARLGRARRFPRGGWLMSQGDDTDDVVYLVRGRVKVSTVTPDGIDVVCAVHGPGCVIGHFEAIDDDGQGRTASVIALDTVDCQFIRGAEFRAFLLQRPEVAMALLRAVVRDLRAAERRRTDVASGNVTRHLARFLLEQLELRRQAGDTNGDLGFGLSQAELAGVVSSSRAAVVRGLSTLRKRGAVATSPRRIVVTDIGALRSAAR